MSISRLGQLHQLLTGYRDRQASLGSDIADRYSPLQPINSIHYERLGSCSHSYLVSSLITDHSPYAPPAIRAQLPAIEM